MASGRTDARLALNPELQKKLEEVRARRAFDVDSWIDQKTDMLNDYMRKAGLKACCVSVSGGVDSACVLAIALRAQKKPSSPIQRVVAIAQPIHSTPAIQDRAFELCKALGAEVITVDQTSVFDQLHAQVEQAIGIEGNKFARGQMRSYMRTPVNYFVAQLISQTLPCIVLGTGNQDEDGYLMYFCKAGDGVVDVQTIADLHKSEVFTVSERLGVPQSILHAPPSADLWEGQTDEGELGFSYDFVELYTEYLQLSAEEKEKFRASLSAESLASFDKAGQAADTVHRRNRHKAHFPVNLNVMKSELP